MSKFDKIYKIIGVVFFAVHCLSLSLNLICSFFPFNENRNFYQTFNGFFGNTFAVAHPYFIMLLLLVVCVLAFLAIKRTWLVFCASVIHFCFGFILVFPYAFETSLTNYLGGATPIYHLASKIMMGCTNYLFVFNFVILILLIIIFIFNPKSYE